jgi:hypothetical protein
MNICRDCRWVRPPADYPRCGHPSSARPSRQDVVTGKISPAEQIACDFARMHWSDRLNNCGPDGKHWEAAEMPGFR